jgi:predicted RND superfamily exporter protein
MIYKYIGATLFVVAVFFYGRSVGVDVTTLKQLEQSVKVQDRINDLTIKLRKSDELLIIEQQREAIVKREEVIKYVTKYRDVIKNVPTYIECIDNSGLLDIINATTPTVPVVSATSVVIDRAAIIASLH